MLEYDDNMILRILKIENFKLEDVNLNKIQHVPMHDYRLSSKEKSLLLIENLQVCIGLYAYSKNYGFASHLNPEVIRGNEFEYDEQKNKIYCNRIDDLFMSIINENPHETVKIGISLGYCPSKETYKAVELIDKSIDNLITRLNTLEINAIKLELRYDYVFLIDTENEKIITPSNEEIKKEYRKKL